jgi:CDP-4-dehydro-6-deoxyglucose reductase
MPLVWNTAVITGIEQASPNTRRFFISVDGMDRFDFKPGQFVTLDLPIHEQKNKRWRSYSIASAPNGTNTFELVIVLLEGGAGTNYLFNEAKVGTPLTIRGPQGVFVLPEKMEKDLYFICTGTGIAPFRSMVHHIHQHNIPHKNIHLIFGCRKEDDCLYEEELKQLEQQMEGFHYYPVLSREDKTDKGFYKGYVHPVYEQIISNAENKEASFFLCGWKNMIDEARMRLSNLGYDKKSVHFELYG